MIVDRETCTLCGGEKIYLGVKTKVKLENVYICPTCDAHLVSIAKRRRESEAD